MCKIINDFEPLKDGRHILTLSGEIPHRGHFNKYRIGGKNYDIIYVHTPGEFLFKTIGIQAEKGETNFVSKEVEFVNVTDETIERIAV